MCILFGSRFVFLVVSWVSYHLPTYVSMRCFILLKVFFFIFFRVCAMNRQGMVRSSGYRSPSVPAACVDVRTFKHIRTSCWSYLARRKVVLMNNRCIPTVGCTHSYTVGTLNQYQYRKNTGSISTGCFRGVPPLRPVERTPIYRSRVQDRQTELHRFDEQSAAAMK